MSLECSNIYPVVNGITVMFKEVERIMVLIDANLYDDQLHEAEQSMKLASRYAGSELESLQRHEDTTNASSREILFWEKWKHDDNGFLNGNLDKIDQYLQRDIEGGGRLRKFCSGEGSRSPYEKSINPYKLIKIVTDENCQCLDLSFQKDSWIGQNSKLKKTLWLINMILDNILPLFSAHFDMVFNNRSKAGRKISYRKFEPISDSDKITVSEKQKVILEN
ncbi:MAG: hypothetical protein GY839_13255 [candidate division Zixibacteria bacterium]|nr:hypothetical protein [candidate division Zixibacteria bacterium]